MITCLFCCQCYMSVCRQRISGLYTYACIFCNVYILLISSQAFECECSKIRIKDGMKRRQTAKQRVLEECAKKSLLQGMSPAPGKKRMKSDPEYGKQMKQAAGSSKASCSKRGSPSKCQDTSDHGDDGEFRDALSELHLQNQLSALNTVNLVKAAHTSGPKGLDDLKDV